MYIHVCPYVCQKLLCIYLIPQTSHVFLQLVAYIVHIPSLPRPHGGRTFQVRRNGNSNGFSTTRNFPPPCDRLDCLQQKFQSDPGKRKALGEKLMGSTWLDMPFFPTQPILEFGYVWILLFVLLNVTSAGKNSPLPSAPKSGGAVLMAVQDGTGTRVWFLTVQM